MGKFFYLILSNILILTMSLLILSIFYFQKSYLTFTKEKPVAILKFEKLKNQKYLATLYTKENQKEKNYFVIYGDQWRLDAEFKKFKYFANLLNVKNKYQLSRIEGRYKTVEDQNNKTNVSYNLLKLTNNSFLKKINLENILIDTEYGTSIYKNIKENCIYKIFKTNTGLLTREKCKEKNNQKQNNFSKIIKNFFN